MGGSEQEHGRERQERARRASTGGLAALHRVFATTIQSLLRPPLHPSSPLWYGLEHKRCMDGVCVG